MKFSPGDEAIIKNTDIRVEIVNYNRSKRKYEVVAINDSLAGDIKVFYYSRNLIEVPGPCRHRTLCHLIEQIVEHCITNPTARERLLAELKEAKDMT